MKPVHPAAVSSLMMDRGSVFSLVQREEPDLSMYHERPGGPISRVVGVYQIVLRRTLEHFFPDAILDVAGDRAIIDWDGSADETYYRLLDDPDGMGVEIEWLGTRLAFQPGKPSPLLSTERHLVEVIVEAIDLRFRGLFNQELSHRLERFQYLTEDLIVADFLDSVGHHRVPAVLEALRVAALSTYENHRVSTGALLLGTEYDPAAPAYKNVEGAPSFTARLTAIKGFHRLCDGVRTLFLVDRQGDLVRLIDVARWAEATQGPEPLLHPCPQPYVHHAKATRAGGHVCVVLTPNQEIKVFAQGTLMFSFAHARWRLLDIPTKFAVWCEAVGRCHWPELALSIFQAALNLGESRLGALFVVLRDPAHSIAELIAPADLVAAQPGGDDPEDPENLSPRNAKRVLHHVVRGMRLADLEPSVLEAIACLDGAVVVDHDGTLITFGAILRIAPESLEMGRAIQGARTLAAMAASLHGPVIKVSEDGYLTMFLKGRRVWDL